MITSTQSAMGQKLYLTILKGPNPRDAVAVVATQDQEFIQDVAEGLSRLISEGLEAGPSLPPSELGYSPREMSDDSS